MGDPRSPSRLSATSSSLVRAPERVQRPDHLLAFAHSRRPWSPPRHQADLAGPTKFASSCHREATLERRLRGGLGGVASRFASTPRLRSFWPASHRYQANLRALPCIRQDAEPNGRLSSFTQGHLGTYAHHTQGSSS